MIEQHAATTTGRVGAALRGLKRLMPWFSLAWGVASALLMARDFAHGMRFVLFFIGLVTVSALLGLWLLLRERLMNVQGQAAGLARFLARRSESLEWVGFAMLQAATQYILLFSLPFLYFTRAWGAALLVVPLVISTLWDPWWERLVRLSGYWALVRTVCVLLATSFVVSLFFPSLLAGLPLVLALVALVAAFPWSLLWRSVGVQRSSVWREVGAKSAPLALAVLFSGFTLLGVRMVPPLGIWLRSADVGLDIVDRKLGETLAEGDPRGQLAAALAAGQSVCCITPIVAARGVSLQLVHEWEVDGRLVDTIALGMVHGLNESAAFRTYSCKKAMPDLDKAQTITCRARLAKGTSLGEVVVPLR
jgi:hypothetical protein